MNKISLYILLGMLATDSYIGYAHPDSIGSIFGSTAGDLESISGETDASKMPGFEAMPAVGLLSFAVYILKRRYEYG